mmetsp:Transcript_51807/g.150662  ORF Transcript_51807/g.150662 Transcript_51807/m.150662 type:complete len:298 (-) Transcript_51807:226-1119(-)
MRRPLRVQNPVPRLRALNAGIVDDLDPFRLLEHLDSLRLIYQIWMQRVEHLVQLEVVLHADVRPWGVRPKAAQVVLLRAVPPHVRRVVRLLQLVEHLLENLLVGLPQHHAGVDACADAPRPPGGVLAQEEAPAVDGGAVERGPALVVHAPAHGRGRRQVEKVVDVRSDQEVDVHDADLGEVVQPHAMQLREYLLEALALVVDAQAPGGDLDVLHLPAVPDPPQQAQVGLRHVGGVEAHEGVPGVRPPDRVAKDERTQDVGRRGSPQVDDEGVSAARLPPRRLGAPEGRAAHVDRPFA